MYKKALYFFIVIFCLSLPACNKHKKESSKEIAEIDSLTNSLSEKMSYDSIIVKK